MLAISQFYFLLPLLLRLAFDDAWQSVMIVAWHSIEDYHLGWCYFEISIYYFPWWLEICIEPTHTHARRMYTVAWAGNPPHIWLTLGTTIAYITSCTQKLHWFRAIAQTTALWQTTDSRQRKSDACARRLVKGSAWAHQLQRSSIWHGRNGWQDLH